jgi:isoleucyl-tRNA synthetase
MINLWIAPILSFTAEEMYRQVGGIKLKSIFLEEWIEYDIEISAEEKELGNILFSLKQTISKKLEEARKNSVIGSSLDATIKLGVNEEIYLKLLDKSNELKFIFITSECHLEKIPEDETIIVIEKNNNDKCDRCWHRNESVGSIPEHENLCSRCHQNIYDSGETRKLG